MCDFEIVSLRVIFLYSRCDNFSNSQNSLNVGRSIDNTLFHKFPHCNVTMGSVPKLDQPSLISTTVSLCSIVLQAFALVSWDIYGSIFQFSDTVVNHLIHKTLSLRKN